MNISNPLAKLAALLLLVTICSSAAFAGDSMEVLIKKFNSGQELTDAEFKQVLDFVLPEDVKRELEGGAPAVRPEVSTPDARPAVSKPDVGTRLPRPVVARKPTVPTTPSAPARPSIPARPAVNTPGLNTPDAPQLRGFEQFRPTPQVAPRPGVNLSGVWTYSGYLNGCGIELVSSMAPNGYYSTRLAVTQPNGQVVNIVEQGRYEVRGNQLLIYPSDGQPEARQFQLHGGTLYIHFPEFQGHVPLTKIG